ncbi:YceD family protein [Methylocapsa palsarum]|uniref:Uncharacterized ACR, COG1399 n=1 Tax=Methylocapsa palsarum TaxID=1612308 RepID=A0A1I3Y7E2_9HYPH|nr:DUF177 domain-containing protein [Methylocapsa palsarum]SFK27630.1 Uncharacterized ACR, COG1399 [Methylocapsa palsarum]
MKAKGGPNANSGKAAGGASAGGTSDFFRPILIEDVPETGLEISIEADPTERAAIAERSGLVDIEGLKADFKVQKLDPANVKVVGRLTAAILQTCVVTLDPFPSEIAADIDADFTTAAASAQGEAALDAPDPIIDGQIDLGALAQEFLILSLDPYPRKPGVEFDDSILAAEAKVETSPFEVLRNLKPQE